MAGLIPEARKKATDTIRTNTGDTSRFESSPVCLRAGALFDFVAADLNYPNRPKSVGDSIIRFRGTG